jgi:AcrR family transcriptional regulator
MTHSTPYPKSTDPEPPFGPRTDRRVLRTRAALNKAILELVAERGLDSITIEDITDRADMRRATFYMHFKDKEELLMSALGEIFQSLISAAHRAASQDGYGGKTQQPAYLVTFQHAEANKPLYRNLLTGQSGALFSARIRDFLAAFILQQMADAPGSGATNPTQQTVPREVFANFVAGAELALITWWLQTDRPYSAEQMATYTHQLTLDGISGIIRNDALAIEELARDDHHDEGDRIQGNHQQDEEPEP